MKLTHFVFGTQRNLYSNDSCFALGVLFRARSHTGVMDYDEACFMHLTPGLVHNFPKAMVVYDFCLLCTKDSYSKREGGNPGNFGLLS